MSSNLKSLTALGIDTQKARFALAEFNEDINAAAEWCFEDGKDWTPSSLLSTHHAPHQASSPASSFSDIPSTNRTPASAKVPTRKSIKPGVGVAIILKRDQPTGRQVDGKVGDVLTSGDHPRGVKVRLVDGRVGRVQKLL
ncbi:hypothetical protein FIBSPDRAFT_874125 [Athelia psychrophila]|uniref:UBA domain-containing protein n=1 Tax=Athelia psychrophila TaxID=1759441 RepID=A0A165XT34_9AGAM|nr:hypothetical protein FIBSPDRAFT_874125 [Fibularhizoctonia sp. CBS 109695]